MSQGLVFEDRKTFSLTRAQRELQPTKTNKKKVIVISGPTCVGKTDLSLIIAQSVGGEIISADSMQVYEGMDIGTAKVSREQRSKVVHHLIDCRELEDTFNVVDFYYEATQAIETILHREHVPIVVGGTGFYLHALLYGPPAGPPSVSTVRDRLEEEMNKVGALAMYERLKSVDPDYASTISDRDRHKIIRGLEIMELTNKKVSFFFRPSLVESTPYDFRCWFLYLPKEILYPRIEKRCDQMIENGFVEEVEQLVKRGLESNLSASQAIGYRQCLEYLRSQKTPADWERFITSFKQISRKYAKRQFTWFKKEQLFRWLNLNMTTVDNAAELIIQDFETSF